MESSADFYYPLQSKGELPRINGRMEVNMSEEKKDPQVDPTVSTEKGETKETTPPSIEELIQEIQTKDAELQRKEAHIKTLQGSLTAAQQRGVPKEELEAIRKEIAANKKLTAKMLDDVVNRISGDYEDSKPSRKTYSQLIEEEEMAQAKSKDELKIDPDVQRFINYLHSQALDYDDPLVKEAVSEDRSPQDALTYLKDKVKNQSQAEVDKRAEEIAKNLVEQKLKEFGLTTTGVESPSAPGSSWKDLSPTEKILHGVSGKK
jgi:hypothetical protein